MKFLVNKPLIALVGAVAFPMAALLYLANTPGGGRGSGLAVALQVSIVVLSVVLFAVFLARVVGQVNAGRVRRWLASDEGKDWLDALPEGERSEFLARLDGESAPGVVADEPADADPDSRVDSPGPSR